MSILALLPDRNTAGDEDYHRAFDPYSRAFVRRHAGAKRVQLDFSEDKPTRLHNAIREIEQHPGLDVLAWFGHGLARSIPQLGLDDADEVARFTGAIAAHSEAPLVILYACGTGAGPGTGGDGGIADRIRDGLVKHGARRARVVGHTTSGDAVMNPNARLFCGPEVKPENIGGRWFIEPGSRLWKTWSLALQRSKTLPYDFPFLSPEELAARLEELGA